MSWHRYFQIRLFFVCVFLFCLACTRQNGNEIKIKIGEFVTKTGTEGEFGVSARQGALLAIENFEKTNSASSPFLVELESQETGAKKTGIEKVIRDFAKDAEVIAVIGEVSSERSNWAAAVAQEAGLPMVSPASTNPNVTERGSFIFRACYIDPFQGSAMARFAFHDLKISRVAILRHDKSNYSLGLSEYFSDRFIREGGKVLTEVTYRSAQSDLKNEIAEIKKASPQAIFLPVYYSDAVFLARKLRAAKIAAVFLGGDGWDSPQLFESDPKNVQNVYITNHFSAEKKDPVVQEFVASYKKKWNSLPDGTAAVSYDAASMILAAAQAAYAENGGKKPSRAEIRRHLSELNNFSGVSGSITIDENRNARKSIVILKSDQKSFHYVKTIPPEM